MSHAHLHHLRLMTWNIRYDGKAQNHNKTWPIHTPPADLNFSQPNHTYPQLRSYGEYPWALRRISLVSTILLHHPAILTLQEVLPNQLDDLRQLLYPSYNAIGVGRDDASGLKGEAVPVFYRSDLFQLVPAGEGGVGPEGFEHFWLSPTPDQPGSVGWDASQTRMCTHLALRAIDSTQTIHLFSTHFDDQGVVARAQSALLLRGKANEAYQDTVNFQKGRQDIEQPLVILMGDFNSPRAEQAWRSLVAGKYDIPASETTSQSSSGKSDLKMAFLDSALSLPTLFQNPLQPTSPADGEKGTWSSLLSRTFPRVAASVSSPSSVATTLNRALFTSRFPFSIMPNIVGPLATFTDWGKTTGRREIDDEIDFIFILDSPVVADTTPSYIRFPSSPGQALLSGDGNQRTEDADLTTNIVLQEERSSTTDEESARAHPRAWSTPMDSSSSTSQMRSSDSGRNKWHIAAYGVLSSWSDGEGGIRMSDHRPVLARLVRG
ncbi:unnamed protein product [Tilletia laevis]|uniref:Endonuclease/exonuclease/phosphatase domain-containing protein n=3 Tax=Tilletia TaxID=13289 RepID=A0A8X7MXA2_9BASI|nr:hypothetical protein CF336_g7802 [Tilletia laevis]KAE8186368.1 hypothetical protein CF328_g7251 [Tilletia controversa]KAE8246424.1 hypothetical protein A4X03_0g7263 [Tilletia caries]KAE8186961.1 hypothetical protein CF335_g7300 [Tilletia laevis]KAE8251503.1 hypothetical protein A4X06_0g2650 [Tilletia controversa]